MSTFETRAIAAPTFTVSDGRPRIEGRAIVFNSWSEDLGGFRERVLPGAMQIDGDLVALFDHDSSMVLGRVSAGTLDVRSSDGGWDFTAYPPDTSWARDLRVSMERGDIKGCSFRMMVDQDKWYMEDGQVKRDIIAARVSEFTVTSMPAYPQTTAEARSNAVTMKVKKAIEQRIGRVLSDSNEKALKDALAALENATEQIEQILALVDPSILDDEADDTRSRAAAVKAKVDTMTEKRALDTAAMTPAMLVEELTELHADVISFYLRAHGAHWAIVGPDFGPYHDLFGAIYEDAYGSVDTIAEHLRKLGAPAPFHLGQLAGLSTIADANPASDSRSLTADLKAANDAVLDQLADVFECATGCGQQGLANFIADRIDSHSKWRWQLSASLGTEVTDPTIDAVDASGNDPDDMVEEGSEEDMGGASMSPTRSAGGAPVKVRTFVPGFGYIN